MAETILKTRIQLKYDTLDRWEKVANIFIPDPGEACVALIPTDKTAISGESLRPQILIKIGDGVSTFGSLPWISAKAADVYAWAKKASLQVEDVPELPDTKIASASRWDEKQDALTFEGIYNDSTNKVATESTVRNAINALLEDISRNFTTEELRVTGDTSLQNVTAKNINANQYTVGNDVRITRDGIDVAEGNVVLREGNLVLQNSDGEEGDETSGHGDLTVGGNATFKQLSTFNGRAVFNKAAEFHNPIIINTKNIQANIDNDKAVIGKVETTTEIVH